MNNSTFEGDHLCNKYAVIVDVKLDNCLINKSKLKELLACFYVLYSFLTYIGVKNKSNTLHFMK